MKKYMMLCAIGLMLTTASFAQDQNGSRRNAGNVSPEERAERMAARVADRLSLDSATKDSLAAIYLHSVEEIKAQREERTALLEAQNQEVKALLTPEQYDEYQKLIESRRQRKGRGSKHRGKS